MNKCVECGESTRKAARYCAACTQQAQNGPPKFKMAKPRIEMRQPRLSRHRAAAATEWAKRATL